MDLLSRKAPFELVKDNQQAVDFHANRRENGAVDALAKLCHQLKQQQKMRK